MANKLLIVDDETDIVKLLKEYFQINGYQVYTASDGLEALQKVECQPDLILLDINMPGLDGLSVCRQIREYLSCPILFLSARIEDRDKIQGFSAGGDDYIIKPFSLEELGARVAAHLRRESRIRSSTKVQFDRGFVIDYSQRAVFFKGQPLSLAKKEFDIVELLSQNAGQTFDKERIYELVWDWDSTGDSTVVAEHIRRIRAKFSAAGCRSYIETVWGVGYKWVR